MLAAQFFQRNTGFGFLQNVHDLAFGELRLFHADYSLAYFAMSFPLFNGTILGEGYLCFLTQFRKKPAYDKSAEIGIYLKPEKTGQKLGPNIIKFLEEYAKENQIEVIIASISGENVNSIKLFNRMGYERCAHYKTIAVKFNRRLDLIHYQKIL